MIQVQLPDGRVVQFPEGTSQDVMRAALQRVPAATAQGQATTPQAPAQNAFTGGSERSEQPFARAGWQGLGAVGSGVADAGIRGFLGVRQLFGGLSDNQKAVLEQMKLEKEADPSKGWRTAGDVAGNIALTALPASKLEKLMRGARAVPGALRAGGAAAGSTAAVEGVTSVGAGDTFGEQLQGKAQNAGVSAAVAGPLGGVLQAASRPFRPTAEAQSLIRQGVNPTLQQGAEGRVGRFIGGLTSGASNVRDRQEREIAQAITRRVTGGARETPDTGRAVFENLRGFVDDEYASIFDKKRFPLSPKNVSRALQAAQELNPRQQFVSEAGQAGQVVGNLMGDTGTVNRNLNYRTLMDDYLKPLSDKAYAEADDEVKRRILAARQVLIDNVRNTRLSPDELAKLKDVDVRNFDVERVREAIKGISGDEEGITLARLASAYAKRDMVGNTTREELVAPAVRVLGRTPRQDEARTALITASKIAAGAGIGSLTGVATVPVLGAGVAGLYGLSALGQTAGGARALLGETEVQRQLADALRRGIVAPTVAGTMNTGE